MRLAQIESGVVINVIIAAADNIPDWCAGWPECPDGGPGAGPMTARPLRRRPRRNPTRQTDSLLNIHSTCPALPGSFRMGEPDG